jgi:cell wall-associated NlpC family hydrolase
MYRTVARVCAPVLLVITTFSLALPAQAAPQKTAPVSAVQDVTPGTTLSAKSASPVARAASGARIMRVAASKAGSPYVYGAAGPNAFDCSGYTSWVFRQVGKGLPRTSGAQAGATMRIAAGNRQVGDLVFFHTGGDVYHVGIYAGGGNIWHSARPGTVVHREHIWTSSVFYGRVR